MKSKMPEGALDGARIAITGSRGLIGRHLLPSLRDCLVLDGDVRDPSVFGHHFDVLIHLAGAMPRHFASNEHVAYAVNTVGTANAVAACRRNRARLLFASTSGVYARNGHSEPLDEDAPIAPASMYAASKLEAEALCRTLASDSVVLRLFNVYGRDQGDDMLIGQLVDRMKRGLIATVHSPLAGRDFIHVADVARAIVAATASCPLAVVNVAAGIATPVGDVARALSARLPGAKVTFGSGGVGDVVYADTTAAREALGWAPSVSLDAGLDDVVGSGPSALLAARR